MNKLKDLTVNKSILGFEDVYGISKQQLRINQQEERLREKEKEKEDGHWEAL